MAHGGHGNGRKLLIVLAGLMLDDPDMQNPYAKYPNLKLSEDSQTMYAKGWTGAKAVYVGHQHRNVPLRLQGAWVQRACDGHDARMCGAWRPPRQKCKML